MIQVTLKDALIGKIDTANYCVYLVRDDQVVFYVGQSQDVTKRIRQHKYSPTKSVLGCFIKMNVDVSWNWWVEFFTVEELASLIHAMREREVQRRIELYRGTLLETPYYENVGCRGYLDAPPTVNDAEGAMIIKCSPCFNVDWNYTPSPLPSKYNTRLAVKSKYPFPFSLPARFEQEFTLIREPLVHQSAIPSKPLKSKVVLTQSSLWMR